MAGSLHGEVELVAGTNSETVSIYRNDKVGTTTAGPVHEVYATNCVASCLTADLGMAGGSNGQLYFWDLASGKYLQVFGASAAPVTACAISPNGEAYAFAAGYDWSRGADFYNKTRVRPAVTVRKITDNIRNMSQ
jgi:mRNA export factor